MATFRSLQGSGEKKSGLLIWILFGFLIALYSFSLGQLGALQGTGVVLICVVFIATFVTVEVGIVCILISMLFSPEFTLGYVSVRAVTVRLEDLLIGAVMLAWFARMAVKREERPLRPANIYFPMLALALIGLISTVRGASMGYISLTSGMTYWAKYVEFYIVFIFAYQYFDNVEKIRKILYAFVGLAIVLTLINLPAVPNTEVWTLNRISFPFEGGVPEPSTYGGYFIIILGVVMALIHHAPGTNVRILLLLLFAVMFVPFIFTLSRTSYVSFLLMLFALVILTRNTKLLAVVVAALLLSPILMPGQVIERVEYTFDDHIKVFGVFDRSLGERILIWRKVWWNLHVTPILGGGITKDVVIDSYYAKVIIETGLAGLACFIWLIRSIFVTARRAYREAEAWWLKGTLLGYTLALIGLLAHGFSCITFCIVRIMEPFWFITGLVYASHYLHRREPMPAVKTVRKPACPGHARRGGAAGSGS